MKWERGKRSKHLLFQLSLRTYFIFCSVKRLESLAHDSASDCSSYPARLVCPLLLVQKPLSSPAHPLQVSSKLLLLCTHAYACPHTYSHSMCFPRPELTCFVLCFVIPQGFPDHAFEGNLENVIGQNERKIQSDLFPI